MHPFLLLHRHVTLIVRLRTVGFPYAKRIRIKEEFCKRVENADFLRFCKGGTKGVFSKVADFLGRLLEAEMYTSCLIP